MTDRPRTEPEPKVLDDRTVFGIREVSEVCGVHVEPVVELVEHGLVDLPAGAARVALPGDGRVPYPPCDQAVRRPGVNPAGASLAVELLDEMGRLRVEVARLSRTARRG